MGYYGNNGQKYEGVGTASNAAYGATFTTNDVIGCAVDFGTGKIWFSKNGVWQGSGDPAAGTGEAYALVSGTMFPIVGMNNANSVTARFTAEAFTYSPPTGFSEWSDKVIQGIITDDTGSPCQRTLRVYRRDNGVLLGSTTSDPITGVYELSTLGVEVECTVICLDDDAGSLYNDKIARVIPG